MKRRRALSLTLTLSSLLALGLGAALLIPAGPASARCAQTRMSAQLMTPPAARIPSDANLVAGLFPRGDLDAFPETLVLGRGRRDMALRRETIAPGLFRLVPDAPTSRSGRRRLSGRYELRGLSGNPQVMFGRAQLPAAPLRPGLTAAHRSIVGTVGGRNPRPQVEIRVELSFPIPVDVVAVVTYWGGDDEPDTFVRSVPTSRELVIYTTPGRCATRPEGEHPPPEEGGSVRVAFVDQYGQVSPLSPEVPLQ